PHLHPTCSRFHPGVCLHRRSEGSLEAADGGARSGLPSRRSGTWRRCQTMLSPSGRRWGGATLLLLRGGRKLIVWAVVLTAAIGLIVPGAAEAVEVSAELEVAGWGRIRIPHGGTWRNRLHLAMEEQAGSAVIRVQGRLEARDGDVVSARLQETTLTFSTGELHWVAGRQVIEWGSAFLIQPTSVVNPLRYAD